MYDTGRVREDVFVLQLPERANSKNQLLELTRGSTAAFYVAHDLTAVAASSDRWASLMPSYPFETRRCMQCGRCGASGTSQSHPADPKKLDELDRLPSNQWHAPQWGSWRGQRGELAQSWWAGMRQKAGSLLDSSLPVPEHQPGRACCTLRASRRRALLEIKFLFARLGLRINSPVTPPSTSLCPSHHEALSLSPLKELT